MVAINIDGLHFMFSVGDDRYSSFCREFFTAVRFGLVGVLATAVHIATVWILLAATGIAPIPANTLAFLIAFGVSFAGHYAWTFRAPGKPRRAILRFSVIAVFGFLVNTLVLAFLIQKGYFSPVVSAVFSVSIIPVISFLASRLWGFK